MLTLSKTCLRSSRLTITTPLRKNKWKQKSQQEKKRTIERPTKPKVELLKYVNPLIRNLLNQDLLNDNESFINLQMINREKYLNIENTCNLLNEFIHDRDNFAEISKILNWERVWLYFFLSLFKKTS